MVITISFEPPMLVWWLQVRESKWLGCHTVYMLIQCTPLLVGVAPDVTFGISTCKQGRVQVRDPLWIWNPWERTHEVQTGAISGSTNWATLYFHIYICCFFLYLTLMMWYSFGLLHFSRPIQNEVGNVGILVLDGDLFKLYSSFSIPLAFWYKFKWKWIDVTHI